MTRKNLIPWLFFIASRSAPKGGKMHAWGDLVDLPTRNLVLEANPHYYDYLHRITIQGNNCKMLDGGGQCLQLKTCGTVQITKNSETTGNMKFHFPVTAEYPDPEDLFYDPNAPEDPSKKIKEVDFTVAFKIESGRFVMREQVVWNQAKETWRILTTSRRYVFAKDPIAAYYEAFHGGAEEARAGNLYFMIENVSDEQIYYNVTDIKYIPFNQLNPEDRALLAKADADAEAREAAYRAKYADGNSSSDSSDQAPDSP